LTVEEYQKLSNDKESILDLLAMPEAAEIEFNPPKLGDNIFRPADFS
jgi:hypothetical protein